jgi:hypothetical protein
MQGWSLQAMQTWMAAMSGQSSSIWILDGLTLCTPGSWAAVQASMHSLQYVQLLFLIVNMVNSLYHLNILTSGHHEKLGFCFKIRPSIKFSRRQAAFSPAAPSAVLALFQ